ncbi:cytochrome P450 [Halobacteriales archaeon QS_1_68_20]|nr:MAG: cytochrome P450 [Halobacteriales archaeon QS_1_68_20]
MSKRHPPGPDGLPVIGNVLPVTRNPFEFFADCAATYDDVVYVPSVGTDLYLLTHPDFVKQVLVTDRRKFEKPDIVQRKLRSVFGNGLLVSEGKFWKRQRNLIQPAFTPDRLEEYVSVMRECAQARVESWEAGETYDVQHEMESLALRILVDSMFGTDLDYDAAGIGDAVRGLFEKFRSPTYLLVPDWVPTPKNRRYQRSVEHLESIVDDLVEECRQQGDEQDHLLARLVAARTDEGVGMSDETLRDEMMNMLLAGHETSAVSLTCTWYLLSENPRVRRKLQAELDEVLGGRPPTVEDIPDLEYTEKVINESLRLYPPVFSIPREPQADVEIGGYRVPEGSVCSLSAWAVHRDDRWYDDPEEFRPERWNDDGEADAPEYAYFPFGAGARKCVGQQFELLEAQVVVATVLQSFELDAVAGEQLDITATGFTLQPTGGVEMTARRP